MTNEFQTPAAQNQAATYQVVTDNYSHMVENSIRLGNEPRHQVGDEQAELVGRGVEIGFVGNVELLEGQVADVYAFNRVNQETGKDEPVMVVRTGDGKNDYRADFAPRFRTAEEYQDFNTGSMVDIFSPEDAEGSTRGQRVPLLTGMSEATKLLIAHSRIDEASLVEGIRPPQGLALKESPDKTVESILGIDDQQLTDRIAKLQGFSSVEQWIDTFDAAEQAYGKPLPGDKSLAHIKELAEDTYDTERAQRLSRGVGTVVINNEDLGPTRPRRIIE